MRFSDMDLSEKWLQKYTMLCSECQANHCAHQCRPRQAANFVSVVPLRVYPGHSSLLRDQLSCIRTHAHVPQNNVVECCATMPRARSYD